MPPPWLLVSPASRGIGLQLARCLLEITQLPVIATSRKDIAMTRKHILDGLDVDKERLEVLELDVKDESSIGAAALHCKTRFFDSPLRLAFCIPGILHPEKSPAQVNAADALATFQINTLGPLLLAKHFTPLLPRKSADLGSYDGLPNSAVFALMSARVGSISDNVLGGWYSYRASKSGVISIAKSVDIYLKQRCGENAMCVSLHPGTVKTDFSAEFWQSTPKERLFSPEFAARSLIKVVNQIDQEGRGKCWDWQAREVPP